MPKVSKITVTDSVGETLMQATEAVLRSHGGGLHVDELLQRVCERTGREVAKSTLVGMLAEKVRKRQTFVRPDRSVYDVQRAGRG